MLGISNNITSVKKEAENILLLQAELKNVIINLIYIYIYIYILICNLNISYHSIYLSVLRYS